MNNEPHIASAFDRDLEAIQAMIVRMAGLVETSLLQAAEALETRDEELADTVREGDKVIDDLELQINTEAAYDSFAGPSSVRFAHRPKCDQNSSFT